MQLQFEQLHKCTQTTIEIISNVNRPHAILVYVHSTYAAGVSSGGVVTVTGAGAIVVVAIVNDRFTRRSFIHGGRVCGASADEVGPADVFSV
jgi:hypothetical protein